MAKTPIDKPARGGSRPGAGRKDPVTKVRRNFSIDTDIANILQAEGNQSALVNGLLRDYFRKADKKNP